MSLQQGKVNVGGSINRDSNPRVREPIRWSKVPGNYFHYPGPIRVLNSTFAPSWSVSGEELLRGWDAATGDRYDGVVAVDMVAISRLFAVTGGITVPGHGRLTADNFVEKTVGSYDDY
jgi:hypothetical protein